MNWTSYKSLNEDQLEGKSVVSTFSNSNSGSVYKGYCVKRAFSWILLLFNTMNKVILMVLDFKKVSLLVHPWLLTENDAFYLCRLNIWGPPVTLEFKSICMQRELGESFAYDFHASRRTVLNHDHCIEYSWKYDNRDLGH